jgi:fluoroacetyl-CoA thioesterase
MELSTLVRIGAAREESFQVAEQHLAAFVGSGSLPVLATPWLAAFMENAAHSLLAEFLPPGSASVGVYLSLQHLAPTPAGAKVRVRAEVTAIEGRQVVFRIPPGTTRSRLGAASTAGL